jgi:hypothetical protein
MFDWMGTFAPPAGPYYLAAFYDLQFGAFIGPKNSWLYDWFNTAFGVTFGEIEIEPGVTIEVAFWDVANYLSFQLWHLNAGHACPVPCRYSSPPFVLPP